MFFTIWVIFWNISRIFFFLAQKTWRAIVTLFFSTFFWLSLSDGKSILSQLHAFIKALSFVIFCRCFSTFYWFNATVTAYWKHVLSSLLMRAIVFFFFLSNQENTYIINHDSDLLHDIYNTINERNWKQSHNLWSILNYFDIYF